MKLFALALLVGAIALSIADVNADEAACATVSNGGALPAGGLHVVGQSVIGSSASVAESSHAGVVHCMAAYFLPGDCDRDGDVDFDDTESVAACVLGPQGGLNAGCGCFDFDSDVDVDLGDFQVFQRTFAHP